VIADLRLRSSRKCGFGTNVSNWRADLLRLNFDFDRNFASYPVQHSFRSDLICACCGRLHSFCRNLYAIFIPRLCNPDFQNFTVPVKKGGGGVPSPPLMTTARIRMDSGRLFSLLIMSVSQTGLILRKLSEELRRYERTMDFGNASGYRCVCLLPADIS
jgi:hypothetical protein